MNLKDPKSLRKLKDEQIRLSKKLVIKDSFEKAEFFGGVDQAFYKDKIISCFVVLDKNMKIVDKAYSVIDQKIPYIPGFLGYREGPAIIEAYQKIEKEPDVIFVDGNGILHPRRYGIASQIGLILEKPTIGVAKKLLCGNVEGEKILLDDKPVGRVVFTREHSNPVYVSPGNMISVSTAANIVKVCMVQPHKLPEPLHMAHRLAKKYRERLTGDPAASE